MSAASAARLPPPSAVDGASDPLRKDSRLRILSGRDGARYLVYVTTKGGTALAVYPVDPHGRRVWDYEQCLFVLV